ncbi:cupin domain-containing protein [candidate division KSB3 bacterium]|uniref:Cupin domain-containing protein n=1 Tax=candidate division KSB3 bacterium TaxID=2044937 RepID=A0A9D5JX80_9BACT|nr:cupin domain-containing protein [candidate division KSB3 bacterium]MBD3325803.1 cupin domain-containing protein [candidate division KSB3 bacterium]
MYFFDLDRVPRKTLVQGVHIKAVYGEKIMMSFVDLEAGAVIPSHHHEHEQMGYVITGELELQIGDETQVCHAGDSYLAPANVPHAVTVSDAGPARVLDIFSPPREEYK